MSRRVLKWAIPVDDRDHPIGVGPVLHVDTCGMNTPVYVWTVEDEDRGIASARVYGTGQPVPDGDEALGTAVTAGGSLAWHVFRSAS